MNDLSLGQFDFHIDLLTGCPFEGEEDKGGPAGHVCDNESGHHAVAVLKHLLSPFYPYNIAPIRAEVNGDLVKEMSRG
tara:strand:+ start:249 stop:482 length:234 start_codon:yes stop_codon:yes gene_type:complete